MYDPATVGLTLRDVELSESPYKFEMGIDKHPAIPCSKEYSDEEALKFKEFIEQDYHYNLYLDGLPAAVRVRNPMTDELEATNYQEGIPIGYYDAELAKYFVYNHLHIEVLFNNPTVSKWK